ncbi:MAG: fibrinogen-like YCDxxxxGGGW domain-containing protein, partial [Nannocystaceae bacterium]
MRLVTFTTMFLSSCVVLTACGETPSEGSESGQETSTSDATTMDPTTMDPTTMTTAGTDPTGSETAGETLETTETETSETSESESESESDSESDPTDPTETTEGPGVCGDGIVDDGEECDDGNDDNSDLCVAGCVAATCGDGYAGPGELCDDGNQEDLDSCNNQCSVHECGDGIVVEGDDCDDGNDDNTDACLDTCVSASCGDGFVYAGVEACDDGNGDNTDECTTLCEAPACDDGLLSGNESDVDCGGDSCMGCGQDQACVDTNDCAEGLCVEGACGLAASCAAILEALPDAGDGVYSLDADGDGPVEPFEAYCDMTRDGGGWTLVLRAAPIDGVFDFWSPHWDTETVLNENNLDPVDPSDGKFPAFNHVVASEIRGCLKNNNDQSYGCKAYPLPDPSTILNVFASTEIGSDSTMKGLYFTEGDNAKLEWLTIQGRTVADASVNPNY